ncbi:hypothetical protein K431DRAFT_281609 [Polychaeton citri CBS 116435]|uniref:Uncharacterized protein n=1 Tax=Polychaeton citri CBS 116435 TaxID=1314669 RepID=A0A9P4QEB2_9PEZI|nr:hypothetical protein K431DRAFT_281609 [Polychaeton citri CBS 116435]
MYAEKAAATAGSPPKQPLSRDQNHTGPVQHSRQMKPVLRQAPLPEPPTIAALTSYISSFFPKNGNDVRFLYHQPFVRNFDASVQRATRVVLSVTPTKGFYQTLGINTHLGFLHRPFGLARKEVPRRATILACHKAFDEVLTVGWNLPLASRLGLDVEKAQVIQGYKGDPERRIGIVGRYAGQGGQAPGNVRATVLNEFHGSFDGSFGFPDSAGDDVAPSSTHIAGIAIMNAFHPAEVERVCSCAEDIGVQPGEMLYLTGAVREAGLEAARTRGMRVICVGHRVCEEWGIRYLSSQLREKFPGLEVEEVLEEEEPSSSKQRVGATRQ